MKEKIFAAFAVIIAFFVGIMGTIGVYRYFPVKEEVKTSSTSTATVSVKEENDLKGAIEKVYDSVVLVQSYKNGTLSSTGTGFVYKKDDKYGYVMTNEHVVDDATSVKVKDINGNEIDAKVLGGDEFSDIAVLTIDEKAVIEVAVLGDSTVSEIGDTVFTVGSPLGEKYMGTVTKGILSGKNRNIDSGSFVMELLQTDAAMNPGNSSGPLVNMAGQVIGVNSMKFVKDEIEGMGFSIPVELAKSTAEKIENGEKIVRPYVGVTLSELSNAYYLYRNGIDIDSSIKEGVVIVSVEKDSPASDIGLKSGDVVTEFGGKKITSISAFRSILYKYNVGDKVEMKYIRGKNTKTVTIHLNKES